MDDRLISFNAAIDAFAPYAEYDSNRTNAEWVRRINMVLSELPSAQPGWTTDVNDILAYLDGVVHPLVSPENWNIYSELHDMVSGLLKPWEGGQ